MGFTLGALLVYRLGLWIPLPGIDSWAWVRFFHSHAGGLVGAINLLSGGAVNPLSSGGAARLSILALGIIPYLSAGVLIHLMTMVAPQLKRLKKGGGRGCKVLDQYTRYLTFSLAVFLSYGIAIVLEGAGRVVIEPGWMFRISTVTTLTGGTMFLVWLCDLIRARGVGHGLSLILCVDIVAEVPVAIAGAFDRGNRFTDLAFLLTGIVSGLADPPDRAR